MGAFSPTTTIMRARTARQAAVKPGKLSGNHGHPTRPDPASPGANCDGEAQFAFEQAGAVAERVHINRLREQPDLAAALPDPRHPRRLHLRRRRGGRQDPRQPARPLPRRRPAEVPR